MKHSPASPLICADALKALPGDPQLLLVDSRFELTDPDWGHRAYAGGHIPGALFVSVEDELAAPRTPGSGRHPLPSPEGFARLLGSWGFSEQSRVVVYDQGSGAWAARLWWMLRARGHSNVQVLDGGWEAWLAGGGEIAVARPLLKPTEVEPRPYAAAMDSTEVAEAVKRGEVLLVDARAPERYAGRNESIDPVAGHVPGAINMPFNGNLSGGRWLSADAARQRWQPLIERAAGRPIVAMCGSGITACHNLLALELAGHRNTRLYTGSWSGWITDAARPIATGEDA